MALYLVVRKLLVPLKPERFGSINQTQRHFVHALQLCTAGHYFFYDLYHVLTLNKFFTDFESHKGKEEKNRYFDNRGEIFCFYTAYFHY